MVTGPDGKMRYLKQDRKKLYSHIYTQLIKALNIDALTPFNATTPSHPMIYLCMERWDMFEYIFKKSPQSTEELEKLFTHSLKSRFDDLHKQNT